MDSLNFNLDKSNSLSFWDYKINYNKFLGSGVFGTVYEVVKRPENEKGYLPYFFPYVYDFIFLANEKKYFEKTNLCIKISKSAFRVLFENIDHPLPLRRPIDSFFQSSEERKTNCLLQKHRLSKIKFYKTNSFYSQFKTLVNGHTFQFYLYGGYFTNNKQFKLRKAFVGFLNSILNAKISFKDLHSKNIMYDELESHWEIVQEKDYHIIKTWTKSF